MPKDLKTGWKRIGRSGKTVDGRDIEPEWLRQAAKNYDPELFTALIWPEHYRWFNLGKGIELRVEDNDEGGVDLFAILAPNDYYLQMNNAGQRLFTSMELMPNFRETGEFYLTGLAATDNPASAATTEVRFKAIGKDDVVISDFIENSEQQFSQSNNEMSSLLKPIAQFFQSLKPSKEDDMDNQTAQALTAGIAALSEQMKTFGADNTPSPAGDNKGNGKETPEADTVTLESLSKGMKALATRVEEFTKKEKPAGDDKGGDDKNTPAVNAAEFTKLTEQLEQLQKDFTAATKEQPGTKAGEQVDNEVNLSACL